MPLNNHVAYLKDQYTSVLLYFITLAPLFQSIYTPNEILKEGVGIGTYDANFPLHIKGTDSIGPFQNARITVDNGARSSTEIRTMFRLINNGGSRFTFTDTSIGSVWTFKSLEHKQSELEELRSVVDTLANRLNLLEQSER